MATPATDCGAIPSRQLTKLRLFGTPGVDYPTSFNSGRRDIDTPSSRTRS